jgi:hypothetical protein
MKKNRGKKKNKLLYIFLSPFFKLMGEKDGRHEQSQSGGEAK